MYSKELWAEVEVNHLLQGPRISYTGQTGLLRGSNLEGQVF